MYVYIYIYIQICPWDRCIANDRYTQQYIHRLYAVYVLFVRNNRYLRADKCITNNSYTEQYIHRLYAVYVLFIIDNRYVRAEMCITNNRYTEQYIHRLYAVYVLYVINNRYGVAMISRLLKLIGLLCRIQSLLQGSFAKETYNVKEPTNRSHPIIVMSMRTNALQGGEDAQNALSCWSFSAKEPRIIGLFCGK